MHEPSKASEKKRMVEIERPMRRTNKNNNTVSIDISKDGLISQ